MTVLFFKMFQVHTLKYKENCLSLWRIGNIFIFLNCSLFAIGKQKNKCDLTWIMWSLNTMFFKHFWLVPNPILTEGKLREFCLNYISQKYENDKTIFGWDLDCISLSLNVKNKTLTRILSSLIKLRLLDSPSQCPHYQYWY